jgi:tetratricopeptide (TPR) repeat protein
MPGLITTHWSEAYIAFLNDATVCVYSMITDSGLETFYTYEKDGRWTTPKRAPFEELQGHPNYTTGPHGRKVYFHSGRPTHPGDTREDDNPWAIEWTGTGWAEPYPLPPPASSEYGEAYPTVTLDGTIYFFSWRRPDTLAYDIYVSRFVNNEYQESERLPWPVNTDYIEYDPYVAPDESYLIFGSTRPGGYGSADNYITFRKDDGTWTPPLNLGPRLNSSSGDLCANGTPDGKYFFFTSGRETNTPKGEKAVASESHDHDLYWVDTSFIDELRQTMNTKQSAATVVKEAYRQNGLQPAVDELAELYANGRDLYYFSPYELLSLCDYMIAEHNVDDAEQFNQALADMLPRDLEIKKGFADIYAMKGFVPKAVNLLKELDSENPSFDLEGAVSSLGYLLTQYPEKTDDALELLQFTVQEFPESAFPHYSLARLYRDRGDLELAIAHAEKCVELDPNPGDATQLLERLKRERDKS